MHGFPKLNYKIKALFGVMAIMIALLHPINFYMIFNNPNVMTTLMAILWAVYGASVMIICTEVLREERDIKFDLRYTRIVSDTRIVSVHPRIWKNVKNGLRVLNTIF